MIKRERYLKQIRDFYDSDLVKVIVGIRRCGKSVILNQIQEEIEKISDNVISLNFEKASDLMKVSTSFELMEYVSAHRKEGKCFVFLDEIQEVEDWQIAVKSLRLENTSVFITGSNSKLLSNRNFSWMLCISDKTHYRKIRLSGGISSESLKKHRNHSKNNVKACPEHLPSGFCFGIICIINVMHNGGHIWTYRDGL